jgi:predicted NAD/FAD-binding protein
VRSIRRHPDGVEVTDVTGATHAVDQVVVATHADTALGLLADPTPAEQEVLGAFGYSHNETLLHRDTSLLPTHLAARAAWNYRMPSCTSGESGERTALSYDMNVLERLQAEDTYVVTLNQTADVDPASVIARMDYTHPVYTLESVAAQGRLPGLNDGRTAFAGAYHGWGFHEDGCLAGARAAASLGSHWSDEQW